MTKLAKQKNYVIITGASGGIGRAMVKIFHENGYGIIATDINPPQGELLCDYFVIADLQKTVEDEQYADEIFTQIREYLNDSALVALINNAAVQILAKTDDLTRDDWQKTLNVNLLAPFLWIQAFLPELESAKGSVVNISSIHAKLTKKNFVAYATSKAALSGMTKAMAVDLGGRVRVNAIEPAAIETDMLKAGFEGKLELYQQLETCHPIGRIGRVDEVAQLTVAMINESMQFMNGACVALDGGVRSRLYDLG